MDIGINIESTDSYAVEEYRKAIVAILKSSGSPILACAALIALNSACAVNANVSNVSIYDGDKLDSDA